MAIVDFESKFWIEIPAVPLQPTTQDEFLKRWQNTLLGSLQRTCPGPFAIVRLTFALADSLYFLLLLKRKIVVKGTREGQNTFQGLKKFKLRSCKKKLKEQQTHRKEAITWGMPLDFSHSSHTFHPFNHAEFSHKVCIYCTSFCLE